MPLKGQLLQFCKRGHLRSSENVDKFKACKLCLKIKCAKKEYKEKRKVYTDTYTQKPHIKWKLYLTQIKKLYKLSEISYLKLLYKNKGKCYNSHCSILDTNIKLAVDHDHETGKIRGLLCPKCNAFLAYLETFQKYPDKFVGLKEYLNV